MGFFITFTQKLFRLEKGRYIHVAFSILNRYICVMIQSEFELILTKQLVNDFVTWNNTHFPSYKYNYHFMEMYNSLVLYVHCHKYDMIMYSFGYKQLLKLQEFFIERELYERCAMILKAIKDHNELAKDKLPLSYA